MHFKHTVNLAEDDWSAVIYFGAGFLAGRILVISSSFIWLLQCRCFWNWCFEHKPHWLLVDDIMQENNEIHYVMGWLCIGVPMVTHPWLVFLPLLQSYQFVLFTTWWRPIDPNTQFYLENIHHHSINVSVNDLYALLITTFAFLVLFPLSMWKRFRHAHWDLAHYAHIWGAIIYGIELVRTPFTAHCWFISTPFIFMYIVDRIYGIYAYRKCTQTAIVARYDIDKDYMLLLLRIPSIYNPNKNIQREIGDVFYLNTSGLQSCKRWRPAHPFTTFYNHGNYINMTEFTKSLRTALGDTSHKFPVLTLDTRKSVTNLELSPQELYCLDRTQSQSATLERWKLKMMQMKRHKQRHQHQPLQDDDVDPSSEQKTEEEKHGSMKQCPTTDINEMETEMEWNVGCIIHVHHRADMRGFTSHLQSCDLEHEDNALITYGPYRSSFANIVTELIEYRLDQTVNENAFGQGSIVLIATGAGVAYIIEFVLWLRHKFATDADYALLNEIRVHFSCRSIRLFQWVTDFLCAKKYENLSIYAHFTSHRNIYGYDEQKNHEAEEVEQLKEEKSGGVDDELCAMNGNGSDGRKQRNKKKKRSHAKIGRASFEDVLKQSPKHSTVFFCGSPFIQKIIRRLCNELGFEFYEGHSF
eukprot:CAMPEP_0202691894 /NCGR_PEP_ID=MMETSP1385-20130828/6459_1 /ASSEMBLY_ACC=CAM_ASM_000861 /TAXON_ID=933848 /ORGANISM="Elphidium margaritaceum" /LENGTH=638 /DNA_ID=CAMNT_0049347353 /DNA_START=169 /DNA_END=2085 /DNA_ORIENTATION=+